MIAQSIAYFSPKHEDLSFIPITHVKRPGMMVHTCNPRAGDGGRGRKIHPQDSLDREPRLIG